MKNRVLFKGNIEIGKEIKNGYILSSMDLIEDYGFGDYSDNNFDGKIVDFGDMTIVQGDFNAHSHPEQSFYTDIVDKSWDLGTWCRNTIYKYSPLLTPHQVRLSCRRAFARMALAGVTTVMVSYYLHGNVGNQYDRQVIAAARDVGIRLIFGRMNYDVVNDDAYEAKKRSQRGYFETPEEAEVNFVELMKEESPTVVIAPAIHSMHASTERAIVKGLAIGDKFNRPVQFHLSEDSGDVEISLKEHGSRPVVYLNSLVQSGKINSLANLIVSDCCWVDEEELSILSNAGAKVVLNPRMNDRVKVGEPDLPAILEAGITPYLGTDGEASNDDLSITGERTFLKRKYRGKISSDVIDNMGREAFPFGDKETGPFAVGRLCDFKVLDDDGKVVHLFVGASQIVRDGTLMSLNLDKDIEEPLKKEVEGIKDREK